MRVRSTKYAFVLYILLQTAGLCAVTPVRQSPVQALSEGSIVEKELRPQETHTYQITLRAGDYLRAELVERGIRVNAVSPGPIATPIFGKLGMNKEQVDDLAGAILGRVPMKRLAAGEDVANAVLFLASEETSYITGQVLPVTGGWVV